MNPCEVDIFFPIKKKKNIDLTCIITQTTKLVKHIYTEKYL
jgi:hypothetical protein